MMRRSPPAFRFRRSSARPPEPQALDCRDFAPPLRTLDRELPTSQIHIRPLERDDFTAPEPKRRREPRICAMRARATASSRSDLPEEQSLRAASRRTGSSRSCIDRAERQDLRQKLIDDQLANRQSPASGAPFRSRWFRPEPEAECDSVLAMRWTLVVGVGLAALAMVTGCSGKEPASKGAGHGGDDASGGSAGDCASAAAAVVPDAWVRPAQCNGVGNLCSEGCQGAACAFGGVVCTPLSRISAPPDGCAPYCLSGACMSFDEASCFCTGSAAAKVSACACSPKAIASAAAGTCVPEGVSCESAPCCDCMGLSCVTEVWSGPVCRQPCAKDADCATRCCNVASGVWQDAGYCNCVGAGNRCGATGVDGDGIACCPGNTCVGEDLEGNALSCRQDCKTQADCTTGCCSLFAPGSDRGYCRPCE
jgi:hypothetical protein